MCRLVMMLTFYIFIITIMDNALVFCNNLLTLQDIIQECLIIEIETIIFFEKDKNFLLKHLIRSFIKIKTIK